jgi:hypothetical protein
MAGILSKSDASAPLVAEALRFYTGGVLRAWSPRHRQLEARLAEGGFTAYEFFHYIIHHRSGPSRFEHLRRINLITGDAVWREFLEWKAERLASVLCDAALQYQEVERAREICGATEQAAHSTFITANALIRLETVLRWDLPLAPALTRYLASATELAIGAPEWLHAVEAVRRLVKQQYAGTKEQNAQWRLIYETMKHKKLLTIDID